VNLADKRGGFRVANLLYKDEAYKIIGAAIEVHKELGHDFLESVYHEALEIELEEQEIEFKSEELIKVKYKKRVLKKKFKADFLCYDKIVVEIKALDKLSGKEDAQILNYLKATELKLGLLINFGSQGKLEWKRFIH
jgi:GxxExxY protein